MGALVSESWRLPFVVTDALLQVRHEMVVPTAMVSMRVPCLTPIEGYAVGDMIKVGRSHILQGEGFPGYGDPALYELEMDAPGRREAGNRRRQEELLCLWLDLVDHEAREVFAHATGWEWARPSHSQYGEPTTPTESRTARRRHG